VAAAAAKTAAAAAAVDKTPAAAVGGVSSPSGCQPQEKGIETPGGLQPRRAKRLARMSAGAAAAGQPIMRL
jgi:hypothetical protein